MTALRNKLYSFSQSRLRSIVRYEYKDKMSKMGMIREIGIRLFNNSLGLSLNAFSNNRKQNIQKPREGRYNSLSPIIVPIGTIKFDTVEKVIEKKIIENSISPDFLYDHMIPDKIIIMTIREMKVSNSKIVDETGICRYE